MGFIMVVLAATLPAARRFFEFFLWPAILHSKSSGRLVFAQKKLHNKFQQ